MSRYRGCILTLLLIFNGCASVKTKPSSNLDQDTTPELTFQRLPSEEPVVSSGIKGWPAMPSDPFVLKDQSGYHLFISMLFCKLTADGSSMVGHSTLFQQLLSRSDSSIKAA